jgi:hypothetical protein
MPFLDLEQGSPEWLEARRGAITGSRFKDARDRSSGLNEQQTAYVALVRSGKTPQDACALTGYKKAPTAESIAKAISDGIVMTWGGKAMHYANDLARERNGGQAPGTYQNAAMRTGTEQEPYARTQYEARTGYMVDVVGFYVTDDQLFGLSPDGLIGDDGVLEIKTMVSSDTLFQAVVDGDISEYRDQCLGYLWLLGRQWVDLVLWVHDLKHLVIHRITRDEEAIEALEADLVAFSQLVTEREQKLRAVLAANQHQLKEAA